MIATFLERLEWDEIFDRAAIGVAQIDVTGRYLMVSAPYCEMLGRTQQELLASTIQDVTHPENLPASLDAFIRAIETGSSSIIDQRCIRGDGSFVWIRNSVSIGYDTPGKPQFVLALAQDVTDRKETERILHQTEANLRLLLDSAADGFYCVDRDGATTLCNAAFLRLAGFEDGESVIGTPCHEAIRLRKPDGSSYSHEDNPVYKAARFGTHARATDEVLCRPDGKDVPVEYSVRPIVREGEIQGAVCTLVDVTERKNAEVRQDLLNHELAHRVKNTLAVVQAMVGQTLRNAPTPKDALQSVDARLFALSRAHTVLMETRWGNAPIMDVIESALAGQRPGEARIRTNGPRMDIGSRAALAITMALHELCTNATKYGALSTSSGTVSLDWSIAGGAADALFRLRWKENGGPPVEPPARKGFGSRLVAEIFGRDFGAQAELRFEADGVLWTVEAPLNVIQK